MFKSLLAVGISSTFTLSLFAQSGSSLYQVHGATSNQGVGGSIASLGDINGDTIPDFVVGGDQYITFGSAVATVYSGVDGSIIYQWSGFGNAEAVADAGDVNRDGTHDIMVGSIWTNSNAGQVKVFSGLDGSLLHTFDGVASDAYLGNAVDGAGDINADGYDDLLVGAWGESATLSFSGAAYIYSGFDGSVLRTFQGQIDHGYFGRGVAGVGDVTGDGVPDIMIGETGNDTLGSNTGAAYLYSGADGSLVHTWIGPHGNSRFGERIAALGDLDGDGFAECVIGAQFENPGTGAAHVISLGTSNTLYVLKGYEHSEVFARSVSGAPDTDGDGVDDILVGSDRFYTSGGYTGLARVFSGANGQEIQRFLPISPDGRVGLAVAGLGDINGDGFGDYAVGGPDESVNGSASGSVYVLSGVLRGVLLTVESWVPGTTGTFRIHNGTPFGNAILGYSLAGGGPTATPFGVVDMSFPIQTMATVTLDANGYGEYAPSLPNAILGLSVWCQGVDFGSGALTNPNPMFVN